MRIWVLGLVLTHLVVQPSFLTKKSEIGGNSDMEIKRYDPEGIKKWSRVIQSNMDDVAMRSSIDHQRNIYYRLHTWVVLRTT